MGFIEGLLEKAKNALLAKLGMSTYGGRKVRPASEDPYGDPADQMSGSRMRSGGRFGNVRPASEDPLGDPAEQMRGAMNRPSSLNQGQFGHVKPASEDPLGDPGDPMRKR
jgi:hypothetical protein